MLFGNLNLPENSIFSGELQIANNFDRDVIIISFFFLVWEPNRSQINDINRIKFWLVIYKFVMVIH